MIRKHPSLTLFMVFVALIVIYLLRTIAYDSPHKRRGGDMAFRFAGPDTIEAIFSRLTTLERIVDRLTAHDVEQ